MSHMASDGQKFTNRPPMRQHEKSLMAKKSQSGGVDPLAQPTEGGEEDGSQVAQEHGPANEVHVMHNHEMGEHHVQSMHPDGHTHESMHGSAEEAHEHGKKLAGGGMQEHEPDGDEAQFE